MRPLERFGVGIMFLWLLYAAHGGVSAIVRAHNWQAMTVSDWGTWVGSIGTVATLIGTIWLATADRREIKRQAMDRAVVAAAALGPKLQNITEILAAAHEALNIFEPDDFGERHYYHSHVIQQAGASADTIERAGTWTDEEILPLIALPNHVCVRLAGTRPIIQQNISEMRELAAVAAYGWEADTIEIHRKVVVEALVKSCDALHFVINECQRAVRDAVRS